MVVIRGGLLDGFYMPVVIYFAQYISEGKVNSYLSFDFIDADI